MRHRKAGIKLNRTTSHRNAMFRNMVTSLFKYDRIRTTDAKAKELRRWADRLITLAKRGDLHARRQALSIMMEKDIVHKLFEEASGRFGDTPGGYTRITKLGMRPGDSASVSLIELVSYEEPQKKKKKKKKDKGKASTETKAKQKQVKEPEVDSTAAETPEKEAGAEKSVSDTESDTSKATEAAEEAIEESQESADVEDEKSDESESDTDKKPEEDK